MQAEFWRTVSHQHGEVLKHGFIALNLRGALAGDEVGKKMLYALVKVCYKLIQPRTNLKLSDNDRPTVLTLLGIRTE
jgi:hypothetical protein